MTRESELAAAIDHMDLSAVTGGLDAIGRGDVDADALWNAILSNGLAAAILAALPEGWLPPTPEELDDLCARISATAYASDAVAVVEDWTRQRWGVESAFTTQQRAALDAGSAERESEPDFGSEYGRLLAERDRLVGEGVDPADLLVPHPPPERGSE